MSNPDPQIDSTQEDPRQPDRRGQGLQASVPSTRTSGSWTFVAIAIVALVIVLVFILENLHATDATFFGIHWRIPLGLDLLLAALLGAAAVFVVGAARTLQLRLLAHRTMRARDARVPSRPPGEETPQGVTTVDDGESPRGPDHQP
ncbi:MAG TPA: hypothetical protein VIY26_02105 [Acidimicrobiales bacterium]